MHPAFLLTCALSLLAGSDDRWPEYRGPDGSGRVADADVPLEWEPDSPAIAWKTAVAGKGWSSPVVLEGRVWITNATVDGKQRSVIALDLETGKVLHDRALFEVDEPEALNALNSYASPSPVVESGRVYVHFGTVGTACLDARTGKVIWTRDDLHCAHLMGPGSSPILFEDLLIFHMDGADVQYVVALDKRTGETVWRRERSTDFSKIVPDMRKAYATPLLVWWEEEPYLISTGAQATFGMDPHTGEERWMVVHKGYSMSARPVRFADHVIVNTGFDRPQLVSIRLGGKGNVTETHVSWTQKRSIPTMSSSVLANGFLFQVDDGGIASCLDAATGEVHWRERIGGRHCASPVVVGERVYFFDREGQTVVVRASRVFEILATNRLDEGFMASACVLSDSFVLRTTGHVLRLKGTRER